MFCPFLSRQFLNNSDKISIEPTIPNTTYNITLQKLDIMPEIIFLYHGCIEKDCTFWDSIDNVCGANTNNNRYLKHYHNKHMHSNPHDCESENSLLTTDCGSVSAASELPPPAILLQEYSMGVDLDNNDLIFGKNFVIDLNDSELPRAVRNLYNRPDFNWKVYKKKLSWKQYLNTLNFKHGY